MFSSMSIEDNAVNIALDLEKSERMGVSEEWLWCGLHEI